MVMYFNWKFDAVWFVLAVSLTFLSGSIAGLITGEKMSGQSLWYSSLITAVLPILYRIFFGTGLLWLAIILSNVVLFFILPLWWKPLEESKATYSYMVFLMFNSILGLTLFWIMNILA